MQLPLASAVTGVAAARTATAVNATAMNTTNKATPRADRARRTVCIVIFVSKLCVVVGVRTLGMVEANFTARKNAGGGA